MRFSKRQHRNLRSLIAQSLTRSITAAQVRGMIPRRPADSHKGRNGHLLAIAGSKGMSGAAALVALGALKAGAGLVTVAIPESERRFITPRFPEILTLGLPETSEGCMNPSALDVLNRYRHRHSLAAVALGPGISKHSSVRFIVKSILKHWDIPLVLDADGINQCRPSDLHRYPQLILTPHPGEFARLLNLSPAIVKKDGIPLAENLARKQKVVCVLKGHRTLTTNGSTTWINTTGNAAMATAGMGDVLTGIIGGFLAQGLSVLEAAVSGVFIHGLAGDLAAVSDRASRDGIGYGNTPGVEVYWFKVKDLMDPGLQSAGVTRRENL